MTSWICLLAKLYGSFDFQKHNKLCYIRCQYTGRPLGHVFVEQLVLSYEHNMITFYITSILKVQYINANTDSPRRSQWPPLHLRFVYKSQYKISILFDIAFVFRPAFLYFFFTYLIIIFVFLSYISQYWQMFGVG